MRLGAVLHNWRYLEQLNIREAAKMMGTSAATLCRIERGEYMDGKTLGRILTWLMSEARERG